VSNTWIIRSAIVFFILLFIYLYHFFEFSTLFSLNSLKENHEWFLQYYQSNPLTLITIYFFSYVIITALSLPGAAVFTLAGGAIFGLWMGTLIVSFASTLGATLAFLSARFLLKDFVQNKFKDRLIKINSGIEKEGAFYLFSLRMIPLFPFFLVNLLMGLTPIKVSTYFFISQVGMLLGTIAYVNAGTELAQIVSPLGLLSPSLIFSFIFIGLLPLASKKFISLLKAQKYLKKYKKPKKFDYNIIVIGAGSGGLVSAYIASALKAKVALIEKHKMGGDCLNTGCVPSKALIQSAKHNHWIKNSHRFGLKGEPHSVDFNQVMSRILNIIKKIEPHDSIERYTNLGVECIKGEAQILSPYEVQVNNKILKTKNIIIATGASPTIPPLPGLSEVAYLTSDSLWNLKELPKKFIILGGGPIGCELAQSYARLGSEVTLIEMSSRLLIREDPEVSHLIQGKFIEEGLDIKTSHKAKSIIQENNKKYLLCEHEEKEIKIEFDQILIALGRKANIKGFGLEHLNIDISPSGTLEVDEYLRTLKYPNIFACGDVAGPYQFTHTASHQAGYAVLNSLFSPLKSFKADYRVIPWCTFTDPEVARVGLNELLAKEMGMDYQVSTYGIEDLDRAITEDEDHGFVKVITPKKGDKILGVTIVGAHAGDIISEYILAMKNGLGLNKILNTIHIYPTYAEANKFAAGVWKKKNAPQSALKFLQKFHSWRR